MSLTVNTNTVALTAQNNLNNSQKSLNSAIEKLSSGSKINSAKDNAAGEAIANRLTSQISGLQQASSNANDGISIAQTTEGALNQVNDNLQRIRTLAVQAANGTNSQQDLGSIQDEIQQRLDEIDRVSQQTAFNGTKVLDGSKDSISIQVGSQDGQTISIKLQNVDSSTLGLGTFNVNGFVGTPQQATAGDDGAGNAVAVTTSSATDTGGNDVTGSYTLQTDDNGNYFATDGTDTFAVSNVSIDATTDATAPTASFTVDVAGGAVSAKSSNPLATLDSALNTVDNLRSGLGAVQNRFESAINNIDSTSVNLSSAKSRITDADYATQVSNLSKAKILQQAGQSVLAQANQTSQGVITLLRSA